MAFPSLNDRLALALDEDHARLDVTTSLFADRSIKAVVVVREAGLWCGGGVLKPLFTLLHPRIKTQLFLDDGRAVKKNQVVAQLNGSARAILGGERTFLNLVGHMSGVATLTRRYVEAVKGTSAKILDTRKTTPLWRDLEKYAVRCGGGHNHRMTLADAVLFKDNHLAWARQNKWDWAAIQRKFEGAFARHKLKFIEMEAKTLEEVWGAIQTGAHIIMLDNMPVPAMKTAIRLIKSARSPGSAAPLIEISGGVTLKNVRNKALLGVDRISVGALTHSVPTLNISLEVI